MPKNEQRLQVLTKSFDATLKNLQDIGAHNDPLINAFNLLQSLKISFLEYRKTLPTKGIKSLASRESQLSTVKSIIDTLDAHISKVAAVQQHFGLHNIPGVIKEELKDVKQQHNILLDELIDVSQYGEKNRDTIKGNINIIKEKLAQTAQLIKIDEQRTNELQEQFRQVDSNIIDLQRRNKTITNELRKKIIQAREIAATAQKSYSENLAAVAYGKTATTNSQQLILDITLRKENLAKNYDERISKIREQISVLDNTIEAEKVNIFKEHQQQLIALQEQSSQLYAKRLELKQSEPDGSDRIKVINKQLDDIDDKINLLGIEKKAKIDKLAEQENAKDKLQDDISVIYAQREEALVEINKDYDIAITHLNAGIKTQDKVSDKQALLAKQLEEANQQVVFAKDKLKQYEAQSALELHELEAQYDKLQRAMQVSSANLEEHYQQQNALEISLLEVQGQEEHRKQKEGKVNEAITETNQKRAQLEARKQQQQQIFPQDLAKDAQRIINESFTAVDGVLAKNKINKDSILYGLLDHGSKESSRLGLAAKRAKASR